MSDLVSAHQRADFERDGAVHLPGVLAPGPLARLAAETDRILDEETGPPGGDDNFKRLGYWRANATFRAVLTASPVPGIAAQLLRATKLNLLYDQLFIKEAGSRTPTAWHNDLPYWPLTGTQALTVWLAFDRIVEANGALEFLRASHLWGRRYRPFYSADDGWVSHFFHADANDDFDDLPDFTATRGERDIVSWDLAPGDAIAFHALTVHGAPGNRRPDMGRRAYAVRFADEDVRYRAGPVWNLDLVNESLRDGDPLDSEQFPVVYRGAGTSARD